MLLFKHALYFFVKALLVQTEPGVYLARLDGRRRVVVEVARGRDALKDAVDLLVLTTFAPAQLTLVAREAVLLHGRATRVISSTYT